MKTLSCLIFIFFHVIILTAQENSSFRVISYNIWNGYDFGKDSDRRNKMEHWINAQNPDVVALQELCSFTAESLESHAKNWGHKYSVLLKNSGYPVGLTSKYPIEIKEKILNGMHHGALHCKTAGIDFIVVHLSPNSFIKRRSEAEIILNCINRIAKSNDKYIVLGDFNSHSPFDADLYHNNILLYRLRDSKSNQDNNGNLNNNELDYGVISMFLAYPLLDVIQKYTSGMAERGSFPGRVLGKINNESDEELIKRFERIDYILTSPELMRKCTTARVFNGKSNWYLSDHYPVMAEFN